MITRYISSILFLFLGLAVVQAGNLEDVGFTQLEAELGVLLPDGASVAVSQVEATASSGGDVYFPDTNLVIFAGKTITDASGVSIAVSSHATTAGKFYYGISNALARGISTVGVYYVNSWLSDNLNPTLSNRAPLVETSDVQNHSWTGSSGIADDYLMRFDFMIERDGFVAVVGLDNGASLPVPELMAQAYNAISVGMTSGGHSAGLTTIAEAGRQKPDIVAPFGATSWAAAQVSSAAALILDQAAGALNDQPQVVKAILLAGATKAEFPDWDRTSSRPLDEIFGAGELNIYNSYHITDAGEQASSTSTNVLLKGWDALPVTSGQTERYFLEVPEGHLLHRFSAVATWHRIISDSPGFGFVPMVASFSNVELAFKESASFVPGTTVDLSTSAVDNVEHIYQHNLPAGQYVLEVTSDGSADCGVAWRGELVALPSSPTISVGASDDAVIRFGVSEGFDYRIEATANLNPTSLWQTIFSGSVNSNVLEYTDSDATLYEHRYYRFGPEP